MRISLPGQGNQRDSVGGAAKWSEANHKRGVRMQRTRRQTNGWESENWLKLTASYFQLLHPWNCLFLVSLCKLHCTARHIEGWFAACCSFLNIKLTILRPLFVYSFFSFRTPLGPKLSFPIFQLKIDKLTTSFVVLFSLMRNYRRECAVAAGKIPERRRRRRRR